ncbi:MAG: acyl-CoA thioesterase [Planctomycetaceae bacterium]|nr:acyl-CoA thioesterase [Planctomycetaceae bacterium]
MPQYIATRRVQFAETDMAGIVHFANFYRWMEETEHEFFRSLGFTIMEPQDNDTYLGWPRVSASCTFERPLKYDDEFQVRLDIERIGVKSVTYAIEFWQEQRIAYGRLKTACCICGAHANIKSIPIPEHYLALLHESDELPRKTGKETQG